MGPKRTMDVEAALRWAFRDELPKPGRARASGALASSWGMVATYVETLIRAQPNRYGLTPNFCEDGEPDPDAVALGAAALALDAQPVVVPAGWDPTADVGCDDIAAPLMRAAVGAAMGRLAVRDAAGDWVLREKPSRIVARWALAKCAAQPDWAIDRPQAKPVCDEAGGWPRWFRTIEVWEGDEGGNPELGCWRTIEVDGFDAKRRRPHPDAYRKYALDPDPGLGIEGRIEYEVWRDCLDLVADAVAGKLASIRVTRSLRPARPWEGGRSPRVWVAENC